MCGAIRPAGKFSVCYFRDGRLLAIDSVNRPGDHMIGRKLLTAGTAVSPAQAADESFDLKAALTPRPAVPA